MADTAPGGADRLLHCSTDRTLVVTTDPASGRAELCKLFLRGSLADAEREAALGARVQALGVAVAEVLGAGTDPVTGRPCVRLVHHEGRDLAALIGSEGALDAATACRWLAPVARTLATLHAMRAPDLPHGLRHGDVKPANLLRTATTTLLLDFEHAGPIPPPGASASPATTTGQPFTGGTAGFAPPEANAGAPADAAFDVHGLGATLLWLVTGGMLATRWLHGQDPELRQLIAACMASDPGARPTAAAVAAILPTLAARLENDPAEAVLREIQGGDLPTAAARLDSIAGTRRGELASLLHRRERLLRHSPALLRFAVSEPTDPAALATAMREVQSRLQRFPRAAAALSFRDQLRRAATSVLGQTAVRTAALQRNEEFDAAARWLDAAADLASVALALPGGCPIPPDPGANPHLPGLLQRNPMQFLSQQQRELVAARAEHDQRIAAIEAAEAALDPPAAEAAIDRLASERGGASALVARRRDRLHRLLFYLERIGKARPNAQRLGELWQQAELAPLQELLIACAAASQRGAPRGDGSGGAMGLRSLQLTLLNLTEEFPHLSARVAAPLAALTRALEQVTDHAWQLLADCQQKLQAVPVPVRPVQMLLARLDTLRLLEVFVDRAQRPRSQLLDRIEALRMKLDQARATRDRLARGAELAMAKGHWTTGLFDMERAVEGLPDEGEELETGEARRLRERLAEARRRKTEVEAAIRRNVELGSRHAQLQDDPRSSFADRLQVLTARRDCLQFLTMHVPAERGTLYGRDLRDIEVQIALEQAGQAETELDRTEDPAARLRIARSVLDQLTTSVDVGEPGGEPPGRLLRLIDHWRLTAANAQREVERIAREELLGRRRQRRRRWALVTVGAFMLLTTGLLLRPWFAADAIAASRLAALLPPERSAQDIARDRLPSVVELLRFCAELEPPVRAAAEALVATVQRQLDDGEATDLAAWHREHVQALRAFAATLPVRGPAPAAPTLRQFASRCWRTGLLLATSRPSAPETREALALAAQEAVGDLAAAGIAAPRDLAAIVASRR